MGNLLDHREAVCGENLDSERRAQDCARDRADRVGVPADVGGVQEGLRGGISCEQREGHGDRVRRGHGCSHLLGEAFQGRGCWVDGQLHGSARRGNDVRVWGPCAVLGQGIDVGDGLPQQAPQIWTRRASRIDPHGYGCRHEGSRLEALSRRVRDPARRPHGLGEGLRILRRDRNTDRGDAHRCAVCGALAAYGQRVLARAHALECRLR